MFCSWSPTWLASHVGVFRGARLSSGGMKNELPLGAPGRLQHGRLDVTCKPAIFAIWIVFQVQTQRHWISKQTPCQMVKKSHSQWPLLPATGRTICIACFALFWLHRVPTQVKLPCLLMDILKSLWLLLDCSASGEFNTRLLAARMPESHRWDLLTCNSSHHSKAEFSNCLLFIQSIFKLLKSLLSRRLFSKLWPISLHGFRI